MWKLVLEAALVNLACGLWSPVCPTVDPTSSADRSPLRWQSPGVSSNWPLPLGPFTEPPSCSLSWESSDSCGVPARPSLSLIPHCSYFHHTYIQMGRQICVLPTLAPRLATRGHWVGRCSYFRIPQLPYMGQWRELSTLFYFALRSCQIGRFSSSVCSKTLFRTLCIKK